MKLISKIILSLFLAIFFSAGTGIIYAQNTEELKLPKTSVNPGSFYYPFKRLIEKGRERVIFSQEGKISFYSALLKVRLSELDYITGRKVLSEVQGSSERFAYQAGILAEVVGQSNDSEKENLIKEFGRYNKFLEIIRDRFPANSSFWMLIQHDVNTLKILSESLR